MICYHNSFITIWPAREPTSALCDLFQCIFDRAFSSQVCRYDVPVFHPKVLWKILPCVQGNIAIFQHFWTKNIVSYSFLSDKSTYHSSLTPTLNIGYVCRLIGLIQRHPYRYALSCLLVIQSITITIRSIIVCFTVLLITAIHIIMWLTTMC